ncbi:MAG: helicase-related protein [Termitinemataceae bacterium]|nr:MAG: helicase-related protein [Termitinemataceae bacterium]
MGNFITNQEKFLSEIINSILPNVKSASFLVGYFYFSGFAEIYQCLKDKHIRVLVGLEIEVDMINRVREVDYHTSEKQTRGELKATFYESLIDLFNETDYFDSEKSQKAFTLFIEKIKDGTLEIRKTKEHNHAKMYLFENKAEFDNGGTLPGTLITGSSNLSFEGMKNRHELNVVLYDESNYRAGVRIFEELWETAVILADKNNLAEFEDSVIEKIWYEKIYKPYYFYIRVLDEYFSVNYDKPFKTAHDINRDFFDLKYQSDAIKLALARIETHNGVIISDVVGLGKSIIGSSVAHNLNLRTIIVSPPHLVPQWKDYKFDFNFHAEVFSSGRIEAALEYFLEKSKVNEKWLIIIDEAHKYRNEFTFDYRNLHNLCCGNKVMLLTATPFNNRPADIYAMVKLFQLPQKSTLKSVDNLSYRFNELINKYKDVLKKQRNKEIDEKNLKNEIDKIAKQIRTIISPLVIRRSRIDLLEITSYKDDLKKQNMEFAKIGDPISVEYNLGKIKDLYIETLEQISPDLFDENDTDEKCPSKNNYKAARYNAINYVKPEYEEELEKKLEDAGIEYNLFIGVQRNLSKFMRRMLVQRFESSKRAFEISLERMIKNSKNILLWVEKRGKVPIFKRGALPDIEDFYSENDDDEAIKNLDIEDELKKLESKGLFELEIKYFLKEFVEDIKNDILILESIQKSWFGKDATSDDPKIEDFIKIISCEIKNKPDRKIVVFSSYADTIDDLYEKLKASGIQRVFKYTSKMSTTENKKTIERNFDASNKFKNENNDYKYNDYDILVATDAISEGYNLHRAGTVFNYDIPYNPTRVIQRVGRINRINKKVFSELYIYNYFPTSIGEDETRTKEISTLKMAMINSIIGEDTKVLTSDIELKSFFAEEYKKMIEQNEKQSWESKYIEKLDQVKGTREYEIAKNIPHRSRICRTVNKNPRRRAAGYFCSPEELHSGFNTPCYAPEGRGIKPYGTNKERRGVLMFGRKKDTCVFKISTDLLNSEILSEEAAFKLLEADIIEQAKPVSKNFDAIYQNLKNDIFKNTASNKIDTKTHEVLEKINAIAGDPELNSDYLDKLKYAAELGALSGLTMQFIRKLKPNEYHKLAGEIDIEFLDRVAKMANSIDEGKECIILTEELK